jgi:two-component system, NarL family, invasion response regulator UvrY
MSSVRMLIADDHEVVRRGLKLILLEEFRDAQVGESGNARETLEQLAAREWDLVLLDINMPGQSGLEVLAEIKRRRPKTPVLILSASTESEYAVRTIRAGAAGFINKQHAADELITAIRKVMSSGTYVSAAVANQLAYAVKRGAAQAVHEKLSDRELEVFRLIALGKSVKVIAGELALSEKTVGTYIGRIKEKTGLSSYVAITRYALQNKLVE